jgi:hypothetical protein
MTIEELAKLSDEELRVRCAKALGAENIHESAVIASFGDGCGDGLCGKFPVDDGYAPIPNYPADLNAMHEAEKMLAKPSEWMGYISFLEPLADSNGAGFIVHATARQRCIAFIAVKQQPVEVKGGGE